MSHVFHQLYYHFAWATHSREPLIDRAWRPQLLEIINDEVKTRGGFPVRHDAMPDHAHLLCRLPPTVLLADFIGQLKGTTSFTEVQIALARRLRCSDLAQGRD